MSRRVVTTHLEFKVISHDLRVNSDFEEWKPLTEDGINDLYLSMADLINTSVKNIPHIRIMFFILTMEKQHFMFMLKMAQKCK